LKIEKRNHSRNLIFQRKDASLSEWELIETVITNDASSDTTTCRHSFQRSVFSKSFERKCLKLVSEDTNTICRSKPYRMIKGEKKKYSVGTPVSDFSLHGGEINTLELKFADNSISTFLFYDPKHAMEECTNDRKNRKRFLAIEEKILALSCSSTD
jgi:hypothetical protein